MTWTAGDPTRAGKRRQRLDGISELRDAGFQVIRPEQGNGGSAGTCERDEMVLQEKLEIRTRIPREILDITAEVREVVERSGISTGICHVFVAGATGAIVLNESDDPQLRDDILELLDRVVPEGRWRHDRIDHNGAAHLKSAWVGASETIPVRDGGLVLGTWQNVFLCEFDGPRRARPVWVTVYGE